VALARARLAAVAAVAEQVLAVGVVDERDLAAGATEDGAAGAALHEGRHAAPVEEEDALLPRREGVAQQDEERTAEDAGVAAPEFLAHVHRLDGGQV
jgi:hypothetical protein